MNSLKNTKIRFDHIEDKEERKKAIELFQEIVFACGGKWSSGDVKVRVLRAKSLFVDEYMNLTYHSECSQQEFDKCTHKEIKMKDLVPHKNADLIALQAKGAVFVILGGVSGVWDFSNDRENYTLNLPSMFKEVKDERKEKIERIEADMRRLADELKSLKGD